MGSQDKRPKVILKSSLKKINYISINYNLPKREQKTELYPCFGGVRGYSILPKQTKNKSLPSLSLKNPPKSMPDNS